MGHESPEWTQMNALKMFSGTRGRRKQTEVLSGMILWNMLVLVLLVLAVCVQGQGGAMSLDTSSHPALRRSPRSKIMGQEERNLGGAEPTKETPLSSDSADSQLPPNSSAAGDGGGDPQPIPESKTGSANVTTKDDAGDGSLPSHLSSMSTEAVLRGFYVFVGIGAIILIYIVVKLARLRKRRAPGKYRVLSHTDDQEMFPLAAGEGEDEEIFNAAHHQPRK